MTKSPRPNSDPGRTTKSQSQLSGPMLLFVTALDTTWRAFIPPIAGTFLGIGLDHLFGVAPIATIICIILGTVASVLLILQQLRAVRSPRS